VQRVRYVRVGFSVLLVAVAFAPLAMSSLAHPCAFNVGMVATPVSSDNPYGLVSCDQFGGVSLRDLPTIVWTLLLCLCAFLIAHQAIPRRKAAVCSLVGVCGFLAAIGVAATLRGDPFGALYSVGLWMTGVAVAIYGWLTSRLMTALRLPNITLERSREP
jgi:hypothetical protein